MNFYLYDDHIAFENQVCDLGLFRLGRDFIKRVPGQKVVGISIGGFYKDINGELFTITAIDHNRCKLEGRFGWMWVPNNKVLILKEITYGAIEETILQDFVSLPQGYYLYDSLWRPWSMQSLSYDNTVACAILSEYWRKRIDDVRGDIQIGLEIFNAKMPEHSFGSRCDTGSLFPHDKIRQARKAKEVSVSDCSEYFAGFEEIAKKNIIRRSRYCSI